MDKRQFEKMTRWFAASTSRRMTLHALLVGLVIDPLLRFGSNDAAAKKHHHRQKHKHTKKKKVTFNDFGCVNVGSFCNNSGDCCSGICQGKKDKKKCQAHDTGNCTEVNLTCVFEDNTPCTTDASVDGDCFVTTGNANYCAAPGGNCRACQKDADCVPFCGPQAACIVCQGSVCEQEGNTVCVGPNENGCNFP